MSTMKHIQFLGAALLATAITAAPASATIIDQSNEAQTDGSSVVGNLFNNTINIDNGQTITVGRTGQLTSVEFFMSLSGPRTEALTLDVRPLAGLAPELTGANMLGSITHQAGDLPNGQSWIVFDLTALNIQVSLGQQLALVLSSDQDFAVARYDNLMTGPTDQYAGGQLWSTNSGAPWEGIFGEPVWDTKFRTFVTPSPGAMTLFACAGIVGSRRRRAA